ncbi:MAG: DEAD/DEAH box helicase [Lachnospiraceae bacterium]|nr:DEAD/DEAH box helicase [Lachnospiraceae bacterium]
MGLFGNNPDYAKVEESRNTIMYLDNELKKIKDSEAKANRTVRAALDAFVFDELKEILMNVDVEEVNRDKDGIRTSLLRNAGIKNVWQLENLSVNQLTMVRGIGEQMARKIRENSDKIAENAHKSLHIKLTLDDKTPEADTLIRALYISRKLPPLRKAAKQYYDTAHETITNAYVLSEPATGRMKWFMANSQKKQTAKDMVSSIDLLLYGSFGEKSRELIDLFGKVTNPPRNIYREDFEKNAADYFALLEKVSQGQVDNKGTLYGLPEEMAKKVESVELNLTGLKCSLRSYQMFGVQYILAQGNVLLGDEMGLGKTVQAIAAMVSVRNAGATHFVVICPASVIENWCRELKKHSDLVPVKLHGNTLMTGVGEWKEKGGVLVTNYESLGKVELEPEFKVAMMVVDEAHYVKNPQAQRTKNLLDIRKNVERVLFMTGTPLENRVDEMQFLIGCLQPEIAGKIENLKSLSDAPLFRETIAPVYFRRTREAVLTELPELTEAEEWCELTLPEKQAYYSAVVRESFVDMRQVSWKFDEYSVENSSKTTRLLELCERAADEGRKVIVFSFFVKTIEKVMASLGDRCIGPITGAITPEKRQELVDEFTAAEAGKVLVAQIQAGGTGLNIQAASVVVLCEPQLKPSIENQAISRAYRMGQVRNVLVYRLLCEDTVDEQIVKMLEEKQRIFDSFADESVAAKESLEVDEKTQKAIMEMEQERVRKEQEEADNKAKEKEWQDLQAKYDEPEKTDE